jgi:hypothetical protein
MKVTLNSLAPYDFNTAPGDKQKGARYEVLVDGVVIGEVTKHSDEAWRTSGRIATSFIGFRRHWEAKLADVPYREATVGYRHYTRQSAIDELVAAYLKLHPEVK